MATTLNYESPSLYRQRRSLTKAASIAFCFSPAVTLVLFHQLSPNEKDTILGLFECAFALLLGIGFGALFWRRNLDRKWNYLPFLINGLLLALWLLFSMAVIIAHPWLY